MWEALISGLGNLFSSGAGEAVGGEVLARGMNEGGSLMQSPVPVAQQQPSLASQMGVAPEANPMQSLDPNPAPSLATQSLMATPTTPNTGGHNKGNKYQNEQVDAAIAQGMQAGQGIAPNGLYSLMSMMGGMR